MRYDIISDTHGRLSDELIRELQGADVIVHAGDICSTDDFMQLETIAPVHACLGNNDWGFSYGPFVTQLSRFFSEEHRFEICHYRERLDLSTCDIAVCGHTHRPYVTYQEDGRVLVMNPGSPTYPRGAEGPTMGRIIISNNKIESAEIICIPHE